MTPLATVLAVVVTLSAAPPGKTDDPTLGATAPGQAIADSVKNYTSAEAALIPAGEISKPLQKNDLASTLNFPSDGVVVVSLTGAQLKKAFEIPGPVLIGIRVDYRDNHKLFEKVHEHLLN